MSHSVLTRKGPSGPKPWCVEVTEWVSEQLNLRLLALNTINILNYDYHCFVFCTQVYCSCSTPTPMPDAKGDLSVPSQSLDEHTRPCGRWQRRRLCRSPFTLPLSPEGWRQGRDWKEEFQPGTTRLKDFNPRVDTMLGQGVLYSHEGLPVFPDWQKTCRSEGLCLVVMCPLGCF